MSKKKKKKKQLLEMQEVTFKPMSERYIFIFLSESIQNVSVVWELTALCVIVYSDP